MTANIGLLRFLTDTLALWGVAGEVEAGEAPIAAVIRTHEGAVVWIERTSGAPGMPRWLVRWRAAGDAPGSGPREKHPRACASVIGLLNAIRNALAVNRGSAVRVVPAAA